MYCLGGIIADLWNNRKIGEENKAQENASSGDCHTWMITLLFFVPDFSFLVDV